MNYLNLKHYCDNYKEYKINFCSHIRQKVYKIHQR